MRNAVCDGADPMKRTRSRPSKDNAAVLARFESALGVIEPIAVEMHRRIGRWGQGSVTLDDLRGFGREGVLRAARSFDETRGVPFGRWADARIRAAMIDGVRQWGLTRRRYGRLRRFQEDRHDAWRHVGPVAFASMEAALAACEGYAEETQAPSPEEVVACAEVARQVRAAIVNLPQVERELVERYDLEERSLEEAAAAVGLSKPWASRLRSRAIARLSEAMQACA